MIEELLESKGYNVNIEYDEDEELNKYTAERNSNGASIVIEVSEYDDGAIEVECSVNFADQRDLSVFSGDIVIGEFKFFNTAVGFYVAYIDLESDDVEVKLTKIHRAVNKLLSKKK
jgi:hypothetical protein